MTNNIHDLTHFPLNLSTVQEESNSPKDKSKLISILSRSIDEKAKENKEPLFRKHKIEKNETKKIAFENFLSLVKAMPETPLKEQFQDILILYELKKRELKNETFLNIFSYCSKLNENGPDKMPRFSNGIEKSQERELKKIRTLSLEITNWTPNNHYFLTVSQLREAIGKLIFLMNKNIVLTNQTLEKKTTQNQLEALNHLFDAELKKVELELSEFIRSHDKTKLQDKSKALSAKIPIELAKLLISESGYLNFGIIEPLMMRFLSPGRQYPYESHLAYVLNQLKKSGKLRQKIYSITAPFSQSDPSNDLIRITLEMKPNQLTTQVQAKKTILAALLSHMRQSPAGSCFASYLAIELLSKNLETCLDQFKELISKNSITRTIDGEKKEFSFIVRTGKESTSQKIQLDRDGKIFIDDKTSCYIWNVPGIRRACRSIGIRDIKHTLIETSQKILENHQEKYALISISKILKMIAVKPKGDSLYHFNLAKLSFESELHNPFLRIWENVIASMAEGRASSKLRESLLRGIVGSLEKFLDKEPHIKKDFIKSLEEFLTKSTYYAYDNDIKNKDLSIDGRSERGAFILYDKGTFYSLKEAMLIDSKEAFSIFISNLIKKVFIKIHFKEELLHELKKYVKSNEFIVQCLMNYHPDNQKLTEKNLIENMKQIPHTPWKDKTANNSLEVLKVFCDEKESMISHVFTPKSGKNLLYQFLEIGKRFSEPLKQQYTQNHHILSPLIIKSIHACSMMFGHESLMKAIKSKDEIDDWIEKNLVRPFKMISETKLKQDQKELLNNLVFMNTIPKNDKIGQQKFIEKVKMISQDLGLNAYRNQLVAIIREIHKETYRPISSIINGIDYFIYMHVISKENKKILDESIIHFADTNWSHGIHDVHFCFVFNPGSAKIEVWEIYENGEGLYPLVQEDWIIKQTWQIFIDKK